MLPIGKGKARSTAKVKPPKSPFGKSRSSNDEREQTLNQPLSEMDGFAAEEATVIVLAATNRPEILDPAFLRPGRFDRQVLVDRPALSGHEATLNIHAQRVLEEDVDLKAIATRTPGVARADLANLVNERHFWPLATI